MSIVAKPPREEQESVKNRSKEDLIVKVISYEEAKRLGDAICAKYKKAFDLLKDR